MKKTKQVYFSSCFLQVPGPSSETPPVQHSVTEFLLVESQGGSEHHMIEGRMFAMSVWSLINSSRFHLRGLYPKDTVQCNHFPKTTFKHPVLSLTPLTSLAVWLWNLNVCVSWDLNLAPAVGLTQSFFFSLIWIFIHLLTEVCIDHFLGQHCVRHGQVSIREASPEPALLEWAMTKFTHLILYTWSQ